MPTPPLVPNTFKCRILGTSATLAPWGTRFWIGYTGATPAAATVATMASDVFTSWVSTLCPYMGTDSTLNTVTLEDLTTLSGASGAYSSSSAGVYAGAGSHTSGDNQVVSVVKHNIDRRYRGGKPKTYHPATPGGAQTDDAHFSNSWAASLAAAYNTFQSLVQGVVVSGTTLSGIVNVSMYAGFSSVENPVTHRWRNIPTYRPAFGSPGGVLIDPVTSFTVDTLMGSQRRRRIG